MTNLATYRIFRSLYQLAFDETYTKLKSRKTGVVKRYLHSVKPKGFLDSVLRLGLLAPLNIERMARFNAARKVLEERFRE